MSQFQESSTLQGGHAPPFCRQFSIFVPNQVGRLLHLLDRFDIDEVLTIHSINVIESSDHAVIRVVTDNSDETRNLLTEEKVAFVESDVLVVEITDTHTFGILCRHLLGAEVNISFVYPLFSSESDRNLVAIAVDDHVFAGQVLMRKEYNLLGEGDL